MVASSGANKRSQTPIYGPYAVAERGGGRSSAATDRCSPTVDDAEGANHHDPGGRRVAGAEVPEQKQGEPTSEHRATERVMRA